MKGQAAGMQSTPRLLLRSGPRHLWSNDNMKRAVVTVEGEGISVCRAWELYHVPRSTLFDCISGRVEHGVKPGRSAL